MARRTEIEAFAVPRPFASAGNGAPGAMKASDLGGAGRLAKPCPIDRRLGRCWSRAGRASLWAAPVAVCHGHDLLRATAPTIQVICFPRIARQHRVLKACRRASPLRRAPANVTILSQREIKRKQRRLARLLVRGKISCAAQSYCCPPVCSHSPQAQHLRKTPRRAT